MAARDTVKTLCITVLGSGFAPIAPGTWGSAVAVAAYVILWAACRGLGAPRPALEVAVALGILVATFLGVVWGPWALARFNSNDPRPFVLDEFAGQWVALLLLPASLDTGAISWRLVSILGVQFLLFRLFDIIKPPPARQAERLPAGWGVVFDDLAAGVYANLVGQLIWRLL